MLLAPRPVTLGALLAAVALTAATDAAACGACRCFTSPQIRPTRTAWPLNSQLFVSLQFADGNGRYTVTGDPEALALREVATGEPHEFALEPSGGASHQFWVRPQPTLEPNTEYELVLTGYGVLHSFSTGTELDSHPPSLADASLGSAGDLCGGYRGAVFHVGGIEEPDDPGGPVWIEADVQGPLGNYRLYYGAHAMPHSPQGPVVVGKARPDETCLGDWALPEAADGVTYTATLRVVDRAGNRSAGRTVPFQLEEVRAGGCGPTTPPPTNTAGAQGTPANPEPGDPASPADTPRAPAAQSSDGTASIRGGGCSAATTTSNDAGLVIGALGVLAMLTRRRRARLAR